MTPFPHEDVQIDGQLPVSGNHQIVRLSIPRRTTFAHQLLFHQILNVIVVSVAMNEKAAFSQVFCPSASHVSGVTGAVNRFIGLP